MKSATVTLSRGKRAAPELVEMLRVYFARMIASERPLTVGGVPGASSPFTPGYNQSGIPPTAKETAGTPYCAASSPTRPNGSGQRLGMTKCPQRSIVTTYHYCIRGLKPAVGPGGDPAGDSRGDSSGSVATSWR